MRGQSTSSSRPEEVGRGLERRRILRPPERGGESAWGREPCCWIHSALELGGIVGTSPRPLRGGGGAGVQLLRIQSCILPFQVPSSECDLPRRIPQASAQERVGLRSEEASSPSSSGRCLGLLIGEPQDSSRSLERGRNPSAPLLTTVRSLSGIPCRRCAVHRGSTALCAGLRLQTRLAVLTGVLASTPRLFPCS